MTEQELFNALKRDGECWHQKEIVDGFVLCSCSQKTISCFDDRHVNPNFSNPDGNTWEWVRQRLDLANFNMWLETNTGIYDIEDWEMNTPKEKIDLVKRFLEGGRK